MIKIRYGNNLWLFSSIFIGVQAFWTTRPWWFMITWYIKAGCPSWIRKPHEARYVFHLYTFLRMRRNLVSNPVCDVIFEITCNFFRLIPKSGDKVPTVHFRFSITDHVTIPRRVSIPVSCHDLYLDNKSEKGLYCYRFAFINSSDFHR